MPTSTSRRPRRQLGGQRGPDQTHGRGNTRRDPAGSGEHAAVVVPRGGGGGGDDGGRGRGCCRPRGRGGRAMVLSRVRCAARGGRGTGSTPRGTSPDSRRVPRCGTRARPTRPKGPCTVRPRPAARSDSRPRVPGADTARPPHRGGPRTTDARPAGGGTPGRCERHTGSAPLRPPIPGVPRSGRRRMAGAWSDCPGATDVLRPAPRQRGPTSCRSRARPATSYGRAVPHACAAPQPGRVHVRDCLPPCAYLSAVATRSGRQQGHRGEGPSTTARVRQS